MNSNRFLSHLMDQSLIRIIRISALTFISSTGTFDLIYLYNSMRFLGIMNCKGVLPELCIDIDIFCL